MSPTPLAGVPRVPPSPAPHRQRFGRGGGGSGAARGLVGGAAWSARTGFAFQTQTHRHD